MKTSVFSIYIEITFCQYVNVDKINFYQYIKYKNKNKIFTFSLFKQISTVIAHMTFYKAQ